MAVEKRKSIFSDLRGPVGPVVCSSWKGIPVVKSRPVINKDAKKSKGQVKQRGRFKAVQQFLKGAAAAIKNGYQLRKNEKMTALNAATSYHLLNAAKGSETDIQVELSKVKFSRPLQSTEEGYYTQLIYREDSMLEFRWELNPLPAKSTQLDDKAWFIVYCSNRRNYFLHNGALRSDLGGIIPRTEFITGQDLFCYMFFVSADGKRVSETTYLGMVKT